MSSLTPRQRLLAALAHEEPDRVPLDLGGTYASGIIAGAYGPLKSYLHLAEDSGSRVIEGRSAVVQVEEPILQRFQIDTRKVTVNIPDNWVTLHPDGTQTDGWGNVWGRPEGGHFYVIHSPFAAEPSRQALARHPWPDPDDPRITDGLAEEVARLRATDYAVVLNLPSRLIHQMQFLRGYAESLMDLLVNRSFIEDLMDRITDINVRIAENVLRLVGEQIDVLCIGDDLGTQNGPLINPETYRRLIKPRQRRLVETLRRYTSAKLFYHSCGSVVAFIPDLIDLGIQALNPVQVSAVGMDPAVLKREFGRDMAFWGGVDTQRVLPFGTAAEVAAEVQRRFAELGPGGGWVCAAVHNIQPGVPPENICALFDTAAEVGWYGPVNRREGGPPIAHRL
jgi:uroporphyrinogen decarboxylase